MDKITNDFNKASICTEKHQVTAVLVNVAIKAASGVDLPVSDFLNGAKSYLVEELADRLPDEDSIEQALDGSAVPAEEGEAKTLVGEAYEELKSS